MKKILLINPKRVGRGQSSVNYMSATPLALPLLASMVPSDFEVSIIDENNQHIDYDQNVDLVGISVMLHVGPQAISIAQEFKKRNVPVVMGGFFPSLWPEKAAPYVDSIVRGEGEHLWLHLLDDLKNDRPLKPIYKQDGYIDLKETPIVKREFMQGADCYHVETTRGCPYACDYCSVSRFYGKTYRHRPIKDVVKQLEQLTDKPVFFVDDNIAADTKYAKELFRKIAHLNIVWSGQFTLFSAKDTELLDLAYKSGCKFLFAGIETLNKQNLEDVNKSWAQPEKYPDYIKMVHDAGIALYGSFMFGFEHDDASVFEKTLHFAEETKIELALFSAIFPMEGAEFYAQLKRENRVFETDMAKFNGQHATFYPKLMTPEELDEGLLWIWQNFYSKKSIQKRLAHCFSKVSLSNISADGKYSMEEMMVYLNTAFRVAVEDF